MGGYCGLRDGAGGKYVWWAQVQVVDVEGWRVCLTIGYKVGEGDELVELVVDVGDVVGFSLGGFT